MNLSKSRLRKVRRYLALTFQDSRLTDEERLVLAVGALIANDRGAFTDDDLETAYADPSVVQVARVQLQRAKGAARMT